jgi:hypothetical protein
MQSKYNIDAVQRNKLNINSIVFPFGTKRQPTWGYELVKLVCDIYHLRSIYLYQYNAGKNYREACVEVFGAQESLELAEYSLNFILRAAMNAYKYYEGPRGIRAKNSFIRSFIKGCGTNLRSNKANRESQNETVISTDQNLRSDGANRESEGQTTVAADENAIILIEAQRLILAEGAKALDFKYPKTKNSRAGGGVDPDAANAGYDAGKSTSINPGVTKGEKNLAITG